MRLALFEEGEQGFKLGSVVDLHNVSYQHARELADGDLFLVRVNQNQISRKQDAHDVVRAPLVNRNPAIPLTVDVSEKLLVNRKVDIKFEDLVEGSHDLVGRFLVQLKRRGEDFPLLGVEELLLFVDLKEALHLVFIVDVSHVFSQNFI